MNYSIENCPFCGAEINCAAGCCTECGAELPEGANYCPECGASVDDTFCCPACGEEITEEAVEKYEALSEAEKTELCKQHELKHAQAEQAKAEAQKADAAQRAQRQQAATDAENAWLKDITAFLQAKDVNATPKLAFSYTSCKLSLPLVGKKVASITLLRDNWQDTLTQLLSVYPKLKECAEACEGLKVE